jgi:hypothetical protein
VVHQDCFPHFLHRRRVLVPDLPQLPSYPRTFYHQQVSSKKAYLCGGLDALRLELVQVIDGALRMGGGAEDRAVIVLQDLQP